MSLNRICSNLLPSRFPSRPSHPKKQLKKSQKLNGKNLGWGIFFGGIFSWYRKNMEDMILSLGQDFEFYKIVEVTN